MILNLIFELFKILLMYLLRRCIQNTENVCLYSTKDLEELLPSHKRYRVHGGLC